MDSISGSQTFFFFFFLAVGKVLLYKMKSHCVKIEARHPGFKEVEAHERFPLQQPLEKFCPNRKDPRIGSCRKKPTGARSASGPSRLCSSAHLHTTGGTPSHLISKLWAKRPFLFYTECIHSSPSFLVHVTEICQRNAAIFSCFLFLSNFLGG